MENVEIKMEEAPKKKVEKKVTRKVKKDEMSAERKAALKEFMELRNEKRKELGLPMAYKQEEIDAL